jgi:hypothetical protein
VAPSIRAGSSAPSTKLPSRPSRQPTTVELEAEEEEDTSTDELAQSSRSSRNSRNYTALSTKSSTKTSAVRISSRSIGKSSKKATPDHDAETDDAAGQGRVRRKPSSSKVKASKEPPGRKSKASRITEVTEEAEETTALRKSARGLSKSRRGKVAESDLESIIEAEDSEPQPSRAKAGSRAKTGRTQTSDKDLDVPTGPKKSRARSLARSKSTAKLQEDSERSDEDLGRNRKQGRSKTKTRATSRVASEQPSDVEEAVHDEPIGKKKAITRSNSRTQLRPESDADENENEEDLPEKRRESSVKKISRKTIRARQMDSEPANEPEVEVPLRVGPPNKSSRPKSKDNPAYATNSNTPSLVEDEDETVVMTQSTRRPVKANKVIEDDAKDVLRPQPAKTKLVRSKKAISPTVAEFRGGERKGDDETFGVDAATVSNLDRSSLQTIGKEMFNRKVIHESRNDDRHAALARLEASRAPSSTELSSTATPPADTEYETMQGSSDDRDEVNIMQAKSIEATAGALPLTALSDTETRRHPSPPLISQENFNPGPGGDARPLPSTSFDVKYTVNQNAGLQEDKKEVEPLPTDIHVDDSSQRAEPGEVISEVQSHTHGNGPTSNDSKDVLLIPPLAQFAPSALTGLTEIERGMTVEEWIRTEIEREYQLLKADGERRIADFKRRAVEARTIIEAL